MVISDEKLFLQKQIAHPPPVNSPVDKWSSYSLSSALIELEFICAIEK